MPLRKLYDPAAAQRALALRGALAMRSPAGWHTFGAERMAWYTSGPAPLFQASQPVVCLHDVGSGSREFAPLMARTLPGTRLFLLDWPGHGRSSPAAGDARGKKPRLAVEERGASRLYSLEDQAAFLESFLAAQGLEVPTLVASGFAATAALHYAATRAPKLRGVALINPQGLIALPAPIAAGRSGAEARMAVFRLPGQQAVMAPARRQLLRMTALRSAYEREIREAERVAGQDQAQFRANLTQLKTPALLALSAGSWRRQRAWLRFIDSALAAAPQHRITLFTGRFHPVWDEPARFARVLLAFVQAQLPLRRHRHAWQLIAVDYPARTMNLWRCVHPECHAEQIHGEGEDPNAAI